MSDADVSARLSEVEARAARCRMAAQELHRRVVLATEGARAAQNRHYAICGHAGEVKALQSELDGLRNELDGLRTALETRGVIEQAKGILMGRHHCDPDQAFAMLVRVSQRSHRKLRAVAAQLVEATVSRSPSGHA
jgi:hypothetical protein